MDMCAGMAVFGVEYRLETDEFCPDANAMNFNSLKKKLSLRVWRSPAAEAGPVSRSLTPQEWAAEGLADGASLLDPIARSALAPFPAGRRRRAFACRPTRWSA